MSNFVIPDELTFETIGQMYSATKSEYRKQPANNTVFSGSGSEIQIPINKMMNSFMNPATCYVNFDMVISVKNNDASNNTVNTDFIGILGSSYSNFQRQVIKSLNSGVLESIDRPDLLVNDILNMTMNLNEKRGMINMGFHQYNSTTNLGVVKRIEGIQPNTTEDFTFNLGIPLIGLFQCNKVIPLGVSDLELDLVLNNPANFVYTNSSAITYTVSLRNIEMVYDTITLESDGYNQLINNYGGMLEIKTQSFKYASATLGSSSARGVYEFIYPHQVSSLKKVLWHCSVNGWERQYGGINPNLESYHMILGASSHPQQYVKIPKISEAYYQNSKSFGAVVSASHTGSYDIASFSKCSLSTQNSTITGNYASYTIATEPTADQLDKYTFNSENSCKFFQCLDLEKINNLKASVYSGINTKGSTNSIVFQVGEQLSPVNHNIHIFSEFDVILSFDFNNELITIAE